MLFLVIISNDGSTTSDVDSGSSYEIRCILAPLANSNEYGFAMSGSGIWPEAMRQSVMGRSAIWRANNRAALAMT